MNSLKKFKLELEPYKNTLVLNRFEVVRLVDVIDGEKDYYWVLDTWKQVIHSSCVIGWIPLKANLPFEDYNELVRVWNLNHQEKAI